MVDSSFRHSAGFGKRMEYKIVGDMLMEGLDCYMPLVDDHGVDCVIKREDGVFIEVQIKARSKEVTDGDAALFAGITHELTPNFYFVFYSERLGKTWILSSEEFLKECVTNKNGNKSPAKTGPVPSTYLVKACIFNSGFTNTIPNAKPTIVPIFKNVDK